MKALVILIFLFFALNALAVDTRPTLLQSFDHRERSIVAEMNQLVYMLFDHDDEYLAYRLTTPGFVEADALVLEEQMKILSEKIYTNQDHQWEKKSFYYVKENYFFYRSLGAIVTYRITDEVEPVIELNLSFRGTRNGYDWLQNFGTALNDLNDETELCSTQKVPGSVHNGFLLAYTGLSLEITEFMKTLRSQNPIAKFRINISGHSLGAALASISALHLGCMFEKEILLDRNMIQLTTFGSPRVFSKDAAKFIENLLGLDNILRFVNFGTNYLPDLVTIIPYSLNYVSDYTHLGHECRLYPTDPKFYLGIGKNIKLKTPHPFEGYLNEYVKENECTNK